MFIEKENILLFKKEVVNIRVKHKLPKTNEDIHKKLLDEGWKQLKEPKNLSGQIALSIPFMIINFILGQFIVGILAFNMSFSFKFSGLIDLFIGFIILLLISIILIACHELLHLVFVPNFIKSTKTFIGFTWFGGYIYTEEVLSKSRACLIYVAPFISLSIILNFVLGLMGLYTIPALLFILFNSIGSSVDILGLTLILLQVPRGAKVMNNGIYTYFK